MDNVNSHLNSLDDNELKLSLRQAVEDLNVAANAGRNSEWHGACFAAVVLMSEEANRRGLKIVTLH